MLPNNKGYMYVGVGTGNGASGVHPLIVGACSSWNNWVRYTDLVGIQLAYYEVDQYYCVDSGNIGIIDYLASPTFASSTFVGVTLTAHNETNSWINRPYEARTVGSYTFLTGIPTPWGSVGSNCSGYVALNAYGNYEYIDEAGCM